MSRILPEEIVSLLKQAFSYDEETGVVSWRYATNGYAGKIYPGDPAGSIGKRGYIKIGFMGKSWPAHHIAWIIMTGDLFPPGKEVDHRNRIRSDNRWENLRLANRSGNLFNTLPRVNNKSGMKGVSWDSRLQRWHARIIVDKKPISLGNFVDFEDACAARRDAELKYVGEYAAVYDVPTTPYNDRKGVVADKAKHFRKTWSNPEFRAAQSERMRVVNARPEVKLHKSIVMIEVMSRPGVPEKISASVSNLIWITNGGESTRIQKDQPIPEGWFRGRHSKLTRKVCSNQKES